MWRRLIFIVLQLCSIALAQSPKPSIRVRINRGVFEQASSIVAGLVEYETPRVQIPNTQQCFAEGCVQIHSFHVTSFRQPTLVSFLPHPPNQFLLRVQDLDFFVTGSLGGAITVIITIPVAGTVYVSGRGISISAYLDLQKNVEDRPYLRFLSCQIDGGTIDTRVANMGLFTDTVNTKYRGQMTSQTRQLLQEAICANIHRLTQQHFSNKMSKFPTNVNAKTLVEMMLNTKGHPEGRVDDEKKISKRDIDYGDVDIIQPSISDASRVEEIADTQKEIAGIVLNGDEIARFFNYNRLKHLFVDVNLLDASATYDDYTIGMSGKIFTTKMPGQSPYRLPFPYRLPRSNRQRMVEIGISEYSLNSILYHAHRTNSLLFHVDSKTPKFGKLLKTTCSLDEVCLSDQVEEVGEKYPDKQLELIIRTTAPPVVNLTKDHIMMSMEGRCLFFLEGTRQKIAVIPLKALIDVHLMSQGSTVKGSLKVTDLVFLDTLDFFGLTVDDLDGFRKSVKGTLENMVNRILSQGIALSTKGMNLPMSLSSPTLSIDPGILMLQTNIDLYNTLYSSDQRSFH